MTYMLIYCTYWLGNPEETYHWGAVRLSNLEKLNKVATSLKRGFKKDNTVLLGMKIVKIEKVAQLAGYDADYDEMQDELEAAFDALETVKNYK